MFHFFTVLNIFRKIWLSFLSLLYSDVEFVKEDTVRILLDTHRNQGIVTVLLQIKGQAQPEAIRRHLQVKCYCLMKTQIFMKFFY